MDGSELRGTVSEINLVDMKNMRSLCLSAFLTNKKILYNHSPLNIGIKIIPIIIVIRKRGKKKYYS